jgi:hypothetical protein
MRRLKDPRPFVCNGSPLDCKVFVVGFNAATEMREPFWKFWRTGCGFEKDRWLKVCENNRKRQGRRTRLSPTRYRLDLIGKEVSAVLETNLYWVPSRRARDLQRGQRNIEPFCWLLKAISPHLVIVHGKKARAMSGTIRAILPNVRLIRADYHLSQLSYENVRRLIRQIRRRLEALGCPPTS